MHIFRHASTSGGHGGEWNFVLFGMSSHMQFEISYIQHNNIQQDLSRQNWLDTPCFASFSRICQSFVPVMEKN